MSLATSLARLFDRFPRVLLLALGLALAAGAIFVGA
jgi:hypothetical protein